jgi:Recombination endonuclease VII
MMADELQAEARRLGIRLPTSRTLNVYGLTLDEWLGLLAGQGWKCPACERAAWSVLLNTDHEHVPGWKNLPPEERKRFVRGVLCARCNHRLVNSRLPASTSQRITDYLKAYEARRDA